MNGPGTYRMFFATTAGPRLRCFLKAAFLFALLSGFCCATAAYATTCPTPQELSVRKMQGTVYGPSGIPLPKILVRLGQNEKLITQAQTGGNGKFEFKIAPGLYELQLVFLNSVSMEMKVRVGRGYGGFFHLARLRIVLGLSGTRCGFATTSSSEFKKAIKRYKGQLQEKQ